MNNMVQDVAKFMVAVDQPVAPAPTPDVTPQAQLYKRLIDEEFSEFTEAVEAEDDPETIDACFDMMWVIIGYMLSRGWDIGAIWEEGSQSNHSKIDAETGKVRRRQDGKVLKPEGWQPPNFTRFTQ